MNFFRTFIISVVILLGLCFPFPAERINAENGTLEDSSSELIVTEIKLGGASIEKDGLSYKEYITIYNQSDHPVNLKDWRIEYAKPGFSGGCGADDIWSGSDIKSKILSQTELIFEPSAVKTFEFPMNDDSGSARIINTVGSKFDMVGWGSGASCFENTTFTSDDAPSVWSKEMTLKRYIGCDSNLPMDTDDNSADFGLSSVPAPENLSYPDDQVQKCMDNSQTPGGGMGGGSTDPDNSCAGIIITEMLPNPSGSDSEHEFIELYNPTTQIISLKDCRLQTTANSKIHIFSDIVLKTKQYKAFYSDFTGLTLNNSSGGSVYLIDTDNSESEVEYPADTEDDVAWAFDLTKNRWSITYEPTPGSSNKIVDSKPCPRGQFRSAETNRCRKIAVEIGLSSCPAGKFRNPDTNRCKNILDPGAQLTPCKAGQFRNPETNRCKSVVSGSALKPCDLNQERNPKTNRCRKISSTQAGTGEVKDVLSVSDTQNKTGWAVAGLSFAGASLYAIWEWRNEMLQKLLALKNRMGLK